MALNATTLMKDQLLAAATEAESRVDAEIARLDDLSEDDLEAVRRRRESALRHQAALRRDRLAAGHGDYTELADERAFFDANKQSRSVICHFYRESTPRCKIVDMHLARLAKQHVEARFVKIDAEKCKFLVERLRIVVLPTLCVARDGKTVDYVVGFDDLGGRDDFTTAVLEWRLARSGVIEYDGDLMTPPGGAPKKTSLFAPPQARKTIRGKDDDDSSDDDY